MKSVSLVINNILIKLIDKKFLIFSTGTKLHALKKQNSC